MPTAAPRSQASLSPATCGASLTSTAAAKRCFRGKARASGQRAAPRRRLARRRGVSRLRRDRAGRAAGGDATSPRGTARQTASRPTTSSCAAARRSPAPPSSAPSPRLAPPTRRIKRVSRAGMGICQGRGCRPIVAGLLAARTNLAFQDVPLARYRPPVRPIPLAALATEQMTRTSRPKSFAPPTSTSRARAQAVNDGLSRLGPQTPPYDARRAHMTSGSGSRSSRATSS